jgi:hypothetical protein
MKNSKKQNTFDKAWTSALKSAKKDFDKLNNSKPLMVNKNALILTEQDFTMQSNCNSIKKNNKIQIFLKAHPWLLSFLLFK